MYSESKRFAEHEVRSELRRIVGSHPFNASQRNREFLNFVVEETLAGRGERLKQYVVATSILGRPDNFDSATDPVVRIGATRVRQALRTFYLSNSDFTPVRISLPTGTYTPAFNAGNSIVKHLEPAVSNRGLSLRVDLFGLVGDPSSWNNLHLGFSRQLLLELHIRGQSVVDGTGQLPFGCSSGDGRQLVVRGNLGIFAEALGVTALLMDASTSRVFWGDTLVTPLHPDQIVAARNEAAVSIAQSIKAFLERGTLQGA